ncbi:DUF4357 domain-containing protein [Mycobacterium sp. NAZ190054]|uniref:DUF4357 domain-containing protein n=1 Tax=Mycobacterium sp. NAZ190054 TaxID=1747766 RepID=UPI000B324DDF|nr:DUF4357 domain-containing protein [Mycobacterium sp. NAZ190054]
MTQLEIVLPVLDVNAIRVPSAKPGSGDSRDDSLSPVFQLRNGKLGVDARAQQIDGEFTMLAGSTMVATWQGVGKAESTMKAHASHRAQHEHLVADGAIATEAGQGRVTRNIPFSSPSTAAAVALGRSCNGRREWVAADGSTFG